MDTPLPSLSTEDFDALVSQHNQPSAVPSTGAGEEVPDNLRQALAWSLELAPQVITNLVSRALQSIDRKTVSMEGTHLAQILDAAAAAMDEQRARWLREYPALLRVAMAYPAPAKMVTILPGVDLRICASEAAALEASVQASGCLANPLAPSSYVQALLELISRSEVAAELRQIWADHLLAALSSQLAWVYLQLQAVLRDPSQREPSQIALAEDFGDYAAQAYGLAEGSAASAEASEAVDPQTLALAEQAKKTVLQLRMHLGIPLEQSSDLARAFNADPLQAMMLDLDEAENLMAQIHERGLPMPDLNADAMPAAGQPAAPVSTRVSKASSFQTIDTQIDELIKSYQNTTSPSLQRVPVPLQDMLETLKPSLRILVREDEPVLSDSAHPARQFLDLICQRSLRYSSEAADGFTDFISPIDKLMGSIAKMQFVNARVFEKASEKLSSYWQQIDSQEAKKQALAAQQQEQMQTARQLAGRLGFGLVGRKDASDAPPVIKQFLMGPWALVLARAQLFERNPGDHEQYTQAVAALLWSVSLRRAGARKAEHLLFTARLMPWIEIGLKSIDLPDGQIQSLLAEIRTLQEAVQASPATDAASNAQSDPAPLLREM
ncbi:MAG: DUF1631 family protein [Burkholderiales bacterium]|nr:MAG: DUF1631 family protein [Burkholderiales bacterium]